MDPTVLAWSGGKDAAFALHRLLEADGPVHGLWTTVGEETGRSSMHGVRRELYRAQAAAIGLPIRLVPLPEAVDDASYRATVRAELARYAADGVGSIAYADVHLADVRAFREATLAGSPLAGRWPLWGMDTRALVEALCDAGFEATVVAVDGGALDAGFLGRRVDASLVADLPDGVDPAGEGGEYHTFVTDGPVFDEPVAVEAGRTVERAVGDTTMWYLDLRFANRGNGE